MVKKIQKSTAAKKSAKSTATAAAGNGALSGAIRESAQQIWLAGLGAFSKAQEEGGKVFETLVKEGLTIQRKTQSVAEERINEATSRVSHMASDISSKAAGQWDKLETLFEERVAKALGKLGVPSARDIEGLLERIDSLTSQVQSLGGQPAPVRKTAKRPARAAAKTPVKTASSAAPKAAPRKAPARKTAKPA
ncbi:phasin family protein [Hydrogenophaga sp.]|uniref:phasin family protein n=1 Tax=Hydrogenophaga sp. TaxID=1904254 RepID=UPI0035AECFEC